MSLGFTMSLAELVLFTALLFLARTARLLALTVLGLVRRWTASAAGIRRRDSVLSR